MPSPPIPFGITCPEKSKFYAIESSGFIGCCASDVDTSVDGICPEESLRATSFDPAVYSSIPKQDCVGEDDGVKWWTCAYKHPPFLGCCAVNACDSGCSQTNLRAAKLSSDPKFANSFLQPSLPASSTSTSTSSTSTATSSSTSSASSTAAEETPTEEPPATPEHQGMGTATVVGLAIGTAAGVSILAFLIFWLVRRKRASSTRHDYATPGHSPMESDNNHHHAAATTPPAPAWVYNNSDTYSKSVPYKSPNPSHGSEGRFSVPPEYSSVSMQSPAPTELQGSVTASVFELHGDASPDMRSSGFSPR